jgi:hypothetical protein
VVFSDVTLSPELGDLFLEDHDLGQFQALRPLPGNAVAGATVASRIRRRSTLSASYGSWYA